MKLKVRCTFEFYAETSNYYDLDELKTKIEGILQPFFEPNVVTQLQQKELKKLCQSKSTATETKHQ